jgi:hypothetical protein
MYVLLFFFGAVAAAFRGFIIAKEMPDCKACQQAVSKASECANF